MKKVVTPATSANLGPGFDILGLALCLYNTFSFAYCNEYQLVNFQECYNNKENLIIKSYEYVLNCEKVPVVPLYIEQEANIPISRGLGSSSSLIIAGVKIANEVLNRRLSKEKLLYYATILEGHPDNVAPCLYGGLVACKIIDSNKSIINKYQVDKSLKFLLFIPEYELKTAKAREVLPKEFTLKDIANNYRNLLILLKGLESGDETLLKTGIEDFIHTKYRKNLIKDYELLSTLLDKYTICHTISGAGPTVIAITKTYKKELFSKAKELHFTPLELNIDNKGAFIYEWLYNN